MLLFLGIFYWMLGGLLLVLVLSGFLQKRLESKFAVQSVIVAYIFFGVLAAALAKAMGA